MDFGARRTYNGASDDGSSLTVAKKDYLGIAVVVDSVHDQVLQIIDSLTQ